MLQCPPKTQDAREIEASSDTSVVSVRGGRCEPEALHEGGEWEWDRGPETSINLVPGVMEDCLDAQDTDVEMPLTTQSGQMETQADPPRCQNPRCRKLSDTTKA
jgi:hypothetical protein